VDVATSGGEACSGSVAVRPGYVFLVSVLVIGAIASTTAVSLVLLGLAAGQTGLAVSQSAQALGNANTCLERTLRSLRLDLSYAGGETFTLGTGTCTVRGIGGSGNAHRSICVEGQVRQTVRRLQADLDEVFPAVKVDSWREVEEFTLCP
jgi:hypothetical protein